MIKVFKSGDLDVKNSPLDKLASTLARVIWCSKGLCDAAVPIGVAYGGLAGLDELRKAKGLEPFFIPLLAEVVLPKSESDVIVSGMRSDEALIQRNSNELAMYKEENEIVDDFEKNKVITNDEAKVWREQIKKNEDLVSKSSAAGKSRIIKALEELNEIRKNRK